MQNVSNIKKKKEEEKNAYKCQKGTNSSKKEKVPMIALFLGLFSIFFGIYSNFFFLTVTLFVALTQCNKQTIFLLQ